jgi:hypothetical protein
LWVGLHAAKRAFGERVSHSWRAIAGVANSVCDPPPFVGLGGDGRSPVLVGHALQVCTAYNEGPDGSLRRIVVGEPFEGVEAILSGMPREAARNAALASSEGSNGPTPEDTGHSG